jgi:hypothetical protein
MTSFDAGETAGRNFSQARLLSQRTELRLKGFARHAEMKDVKPRRLNWHT